MSLLTFFCRLVRRYILSPESFLLLVLLFIIYNTVVKLPPLWERAKLRYSRHSVDKSSKDLSDESFVRASQGLFWVSDPRKASWELKSGLAAAYSIQGRRPHMEDRFKIHNTNGSKIAMYGVFDGHGGDFVAEYAQKHLFEMILSNIHESLDNHEAVMTEQILEVDRQLLEHVKEKSDISGSTALVAMVTDTKLFVANVGDSRAVMCDKEGKVVPLSTDHKPNQMKEHQRIKEAGGFVGFNGVWRVAGILATSRALGDYPLKEKNFIIAEPDIMTLDLQDTQPQFIILASDGLWDCFTNEEAVEYIKDRLDEPHFGAKSIILQAYYKGSLDNITVMVVKFDKRKFKSKSS